MTLKTSVLIYLQDKDLTNKFVYDCLDSIRLQTKPADQVIIHSNKGVVAGYLAKNPGLNWQLVYETDVYDKEAVFRKLMQLASGDILFLSDGQSVWRRDKIEKLTGIFQDKPAIDFLLTNYTSFKFDAGEYDKKKESYPEKSDEQLQMYLQKSLLTIPRVPYDTMSIRRDFVIRNLSTIKKCSSANIVATLALAQLTDAAYLLKESMVKIPKDCLIINTHDHLTLDEVDKNIRVQLGMCEYLNDFNVHEVHDDKMKSRNYKVLQTQIKVLKHRRSIWGYNSIWHALMVLPHIGYYPDGLAGIFWDITNRT